MSLAKDSNSDFSVTVTYKLIARLNGQTLYAKKDIGVCANCGCFTLRCVRCGRLLKIGDTAISRGSRYITRYYHTQCWKELFFESKLKRKPNYSHSKDGAGKAVYGVSPSVTIKNATVLPKAEVDYPYTPYGAFSDEVPSKEEMFRLIRKEFYEYLDLEPSLIDVLSVCVLITYQQEKLVTVPYILVYGDIGSGKTTVMVLLNAFCYRPMFGVSVPAADIYGYLEDADSTPTILEDEIEGIDKDINKLKIYKAGYKLGAKVPRTIMLQNGRMMKYYNTFCFKGCASEEIPKSRGLNERFISMPITKGDPLKEWADLISEDFERFQRIRNMLLKWRLATRDLKLSDQITDVSLKGRLKELWKPLFLLAKDLPSVYASLKTTVTQQASTDIDVKQTTLDGYIVVAVTRTLLEKAEHLKTYVASVSFRDIWDELAQQVDGQSAGWYDREGILHDAKPHIMVCSEFGIVSKQKVGRRIREIFSASVKVMRKYGVGMYGELNKTYTFDSDKVRRILKSYGYDELLKQSNTLLTAQTTISDCGTIDPWTKEQLGALESKMREAALKAETPPYPLDTDYRKMWKDDDFDMSTEAE